MSDAPAAGDAPAAEAKGPNKMVLIGALVGGLLAGGGLGVFVVGPKVAPPPPAEALAAADEHADGKKGKKKKDKKDGHEKKEAGGHGGGEGGEAAAAPIVKLDNLIVNPAGSDGSRFVMASVAIELETPEEMALLKEREIELRDGVTTLLGGLTLQQLSAPDARAVLKSRIAATVKPFLDDEEAEPKVWLPQFVIQ